MAFRGLVALLMLACVDRAVPSASVRNDRDDAGPAEDGFVVSAVPDTILTRSPDAESLDTVPTFEFRSDVVGAEFECRLDEASFGACFSPWEVPLLVLGGHHFEVRAFVGEVVDPTPVVVDWRLDSPYPDVAIIETNDAWVESGGDWAFGDGDAYYRFAEPFYDTWPDDFDALIVWSDFAMTGQSFAAFEVTIRYDIAGIGFEQNGHYGQDYTSLAGSAGRLQSLVYMNGEDFWSWVSDQEVLDVVAQEVGHRWVAFIPLLWESDPYLLLCQRSRAHWNLFAGFDAPSPLGLNQQWTRQNGDGSFTSEYVTPVAYTSLDLYAMGLIPPGDVPPFFFVRNGYAFSPPNDPYGDPWNADSPVVTSVDFSGERVDVTIDQIVGTLGPRNPPFGGAQTHFRHAFVLVVPSGEPVHVDSLAWVDEMRLRWAEFFPAITRGYASVDTRLQ